MTIAQNSEIQPEKHLSNGLWLFEANETTFQTSWFFSLSDASRCEVTEERNGVFELEMEYPVSGKEYRLIDLHKIVLAKPNPYDAPQAFRIYSISKTINNIVTIKAQHISYDMSGYPIAPFEANTIIEAVAAINTKSIVENQPFWLYSYADTMDLLTVGMSLQMPISMREVLMGDEGSFLAIYGGEFGFDNFHITHYPENHSRGTNRGVRIAYGKNLIDFDQEIDSSNVYTAVYPYFYSEEKFVELPEKLIQILADDIIGHTRILSLDLSSEWENTYGLKDEYPSDDELRELANKYISDNKLALPTDSFTLSLEQLPIAKDEDGNVRYEEIHLCDKVLVEFLEMGVSEVVKCIKTTYDVLADKYISLEFGDARSSLDEFIAEEYLPRLKSKNGKRPVQAIPKSEES